MSVLFDRGARRLLERAYAKPGEWVGTRLADPSPAEQARAFAYYGIRVMSPDNAPTASGTRQDAHTRWGRGFVRALYYQHRWHSGKPGGGWRGERRTSPRTAGALRVEWGRRMPALGVIPAGRAVRVQIARGGQAAQRAAKAKPESARIYDDRGNAAGRWSDPMARDWLDELAGGTGCGYLLAGELPQVILIPDRLPGFQVDVFKMSADLLVPVAFRVIPDINGFMAGRAHPVLGEHPGPQRMTGMASPHLVPEIDQARELIA